MKDRQHLGVTDDWSFRGQLKQLSFHRAQLIQDDSWRRAICWEQGEKQKHIKASHREQQNIFIQILFQDSGMSFSKPPYDHRTM